MIRVHDIGYMVGDKQLLRNISADFEPGMLHLVIGPNGAGKSTLIKLLSGQLQPHGGEIGYNSRPLHSYAAGQLACMRGVLSQNLELSFPLKVWEVVMMGRYPHFTGKPTEKDSAACEAAMALFGVADMAGRDYTTLSGGEKQRVHFARVLAQVWYPIPGICRCLLLDEPLTFLDVHYQHLFMQQVRSLLQAQDMIVIGVVHDLNLASKFADRIVLLHRGAVLAQGKPADVLTTAHIKTAYGLEPNVVNVEGNRYLFF